MKKKSGASVFSALLLALFLGSCSGTSKPQPDTTPTITPVSTSVSSAASANGIAPTDASELLVPFSTHSTEGLKKLEDLRGNHALLNSFIDRNRKPDYFFSTSRKKLFLVYIASDNLYLFNLDTDEPYKKFHPMPASIKESLNKALNAPATQENQDDQKSLTENYNEFSKNNIESTLADRNPLPSLNHSILQSIPVALPSSSGEISANTPIYPKLYYLDKSLREVVESDYSVKYDVKKQKLKLIIPQAYEGSGVYKDKNIDARKIYLERNISTGKETALIVPDFFPGSRHYRNTHGKVAKAFGSLYEVEVSNAVANNNKLRLRYSIKLCQKDDLPLCAQKSIGNTYIRAIIISAVLYDSSNNAVVDTFVLK